MITSQLIVSTDCPFHPHSISELLARPHALSTAAPLDTVDIVDDFSVLSTAGMPRRLRPPCTQAALEGHDVLLESALVVADLRRHCQLTSDICSSLSVDSCMRCLPYPTSSFSDYSVVENNLLQMLGARTRSLV